MKSLSFLIIAILVLFTLLYLKPIQADSTGNIEIQDIKTLPTAVIIGHTFKINATLVNNSISPISVEHGPCEAPFSATFDSHVLVRMNNITCTTDMVLQKLDPEEKITATSPYLDVAYVASQPGTVNATVTFRYSIWDQNNQSNVEEKVSAPFSFNINPMTQVSPLEPSENNDNSFVLNFESVKERYLTLINATELNLVITNSSEFKEQVQGYNYSFAEAISRLGYDKNNSYTVWPVDVVYSLYHSDLYDYDKTLVVTMDSNLNMLGTTEYNPWNVPPGYPRPAMSPLFIHGNYAPPKIDINKLVNLIPPSPPEQVKHGVTPNDVNCLAGFGLIFKQEDRSPACVSDNTGRYLAERGWAINQTQESIILAEDHGEDDMNKNGTITGKNTIDINIKNFQILSPPVTVEIFYSNGTLYETDEISSNSIQPGGYYKYTFTVSSTNASDVFGKYRVDVEHNGNKAETFVEILVPP